MSFVKGGYEESPSPTTDVSPREITITNADPDMPVSKPMSDLYKGSKSTKAINGDGAVGERPPQSPMKKRGKVRMSIGEPMEAPPEPMEAPRPVKKMKGQNGEAVASQPENLAQESSGTEESLSDPEEYDDTDTDTDNSDDGDSLFGEDTDNKLEMLHQTDLDWDDGVPHFRTGRNNYKDYFISISDPICKASGIIVRIYINGVERRDVQLCQKQFCTQCGGSGTAPDRSKGSKPWCHASETAPLSGNLYELKPMPKRPDSRIRLVDEREVQLEAPSGLETFTVEVCDEDNCPECVMLKSKWGGYWKNPYERDFVPEFTGKDSGIIAPILSIQSRVSEAEETGPSSKDLMEKKPLLSSRHVEKMGVTEEVRAAFSRGGRME